jgi:iron complex transport system substrate-binding protein
VLVALVGVLGACTGGAAATIPADASPSTSASTAATPSASASPAPSASPVAAFPLSLTDDSGLAVAIPAEPTRIVSLTPGATEILFALGAGDRVVGVSEFSDFPAAAAALARDPTTAVAKYDSVDVEKVIGLGADLVIAGGGGFNPAKDLDKLRALHVPVLVLDSAGESGVDGVLADIGLVGRAVGEPAAAATLADGMKTQLDAISAAAKASGKAPTVFYETGYDPTGGTIYGVADGSFVAGMITLAGGTPVTTGSATDWAEPLEKLLSVDPAVIVLGDAAFGSTPESVAKRPGWGALTAVKKGILRSVSDTEITRPGPRLPLGLRSLVLAIDPSASLPPAP